VPGTVLRLPLAKHSASELRVGGLRFGQAYPVRVGEHRGAQLEYGDEGSTRNNALGDQGTTELQRVN
jgi:flagellar motor switch protein FliM